MGRKKRTEFKELLIILFVVCVISSVLFIRGDIIKNITGFVSFSIYPEEGFETQPAEESNESFGIVPVEKIKIEEEKEEQFGIQPIENLSLQKEEEAGFGVLPVENESFGIGGEGFLTTAYVNLSNGFSTIPSGFSWGQGITTNGTDFWITDINDKEVYHLDKDGVKLGSFDTLSAGCNNPRDIATNGSDFWVVESDDDFVYHFDKAGNNLSDGFDILGIGCDSGEGLTSNGTDFWITDWKDNFVYHVNKSGYNFSDGFSTSSSDQPYGITIFNSSGDFWIVDETQGWLYHFNSTGDNQSNDGFNLTEIGSDKPLSITTNNTDFWVLDATDDFVYHIEYIASPVINSLETVPSIIYYNTEMYLTANITSDASIKWANFSLTAPDGSAVINNENGTSDSTGNIWNSSSYTIDQFGNWSYNVSISDGYEIVSETGSFYVSVFNENTSWESNLQGVYWGMITYGDLNNDGYGDLILYGRDYTPVYYSKVYINNGTSLVENTTWQSNLTGMAYGSLSLGDIDNDGDLDLVVCGGKEAAGDPCPTSVQSKNYLISEAESVDPAYTYVYLNNGTSLIKSSDYSDNLTDVGVASCELSDLDNDGYLDLVVTGEDTSSSKYSKVYINNGTSLIEDTAWQSNLTDVSAGSIFLGDIDNDGDQDLILTGFDSNNKQIAKVYINNGTSLIENTAWQSNLTGVEYSDNVLGDIDNDGDLDLILTGQSAAGLISKVYINNGTSLVENTTWQSNLTNIYVGSSVLGDIDNDGDLDLVVTGNDIGDVNLAIIYLNNGTSFVENKSWFNNLSGVGYSSAILFDLNNDTKLDLTLTGDYLGTPNSKVYINSYPASNLNPSAPSSISASFSDSELSVSFNTGSDTETSTNGLYYNLRIGTSLYGNDILTGKFGGHGHPSGGYFGNLEQQRSININGLSDRDYYCGVQTIDTGFLKSNWYDVKCYDKPEEGGGGGPSSPPSPPTPPTPPSPPSPPTPPPPVTPKEPKEPGLRREFGDFDFPWKYIDVPERVNITPRYKCNGIEFNINDVIGFSFSIYENKPQYSIDLDFNPEKERYCPWCYNNIKDYDETGVDCGGSCPPCVEKPAEIWRCKQIPLILILLFALLLASLIYGYKKTKKHKYEFRIGVCVSLVALVSGIICRYLGVCYYKYLAILYSLGIISGVFIAVNQIKFLFRLPVIKKLKVKRRLKLPVIEEREKKKILEIDKESLVRNSLIEFNVLFRYIKKHIKNRKFGKAFSDYNAAQEIYEFLIDKVSTEKLRSLYDKLYSLYYELLVKYLKSRINVKIKEHRLRKRPYKFDLEIPRFRCKRAKEKLDEDTKKLNYLHKLLEENNLKEAWKLYKEYYGFKFSLKEKNKGSYVFDEFLGKKNGKKKYKEK